MGKLFADAGIHCVVDGQFGSTGKGVLAAFLAERAIAEGKQFMGCISNAGPNSGHTFYYNGEKHVLKQLPTFAVASYLMGFPVPVFLSAGAIIDLSILYTEAAKYPGILIIVHPNATLVTEEDKINERSGTVAAVAGTRSGTGAAQARKTLRDPTATVGGYLEKWYFPLMPNVSVEDWTSGDGGLCIAPEEYRYFMEVSQGFSLGINSQFYPKVTSRECTVMQGIADARIAPRYVAKTYLSMRTFPIRVGNVDGYSSGDFYPDQRELSWEELGQTPELTTVTQRVRRVFTFSRQQADEAIRANDPDFVFLNFMNYLDEQGQRDMLEQWDNIRDCMPRWFAIIQCFGATSEDVKW